jgi:endogenous inhibitor of DNA gyrase (YacG/DUF329 family)
MIRCPICKKEVAEGGEFFPFCSDRCRIIDLANWATGAYRIPAETGPPDADNDDE